MRNWLSSWIVVGLCCAALQAQGAGAAEELGSRRQGYALLASNLVPALHGGEPVLELDMEPAVIEARERWRVITLECLETGDRRIKVVAREAAAAHDALLQCARESDDVGLLWDVLIAVATESPAALLRGLNVAAKNDSHSKLVKVIRRRRAVTFLLPELARELAGPPSDDPAIALDFDENWFGAEVPDRLTVRNVSGRSLGNCTVQVDLRGVSGRWVRNVYFVPRWGADRDLWAEFVNTDPDALVAISGTTAVEVQDIRVCIWSDQLSSEVSLHYSGPLRDADRARQLESLVELEVDYVANPLTEIGPSIGVTLSGVTALPACEVSALCIGGGGGDKVFETKLGSWAGGQRISLPSRQLLRQCPESVQVTIQCKAPAVRLTKTLKIARRR